MRFALAFSALALLVLSAGGALGADEDPARLGADVVPTFESIRLDLDASKKDYTGSVKIELSVATPTDSFRFHASDMTLTRVALKQKGAMVPTTVTSGVIGLRTVRTEQPLALGAATLEIDFTNDLDTRASSLYKVEVGGASYAFTDFEPADARSAFPCFDEPSFKIPWQVELVIPKEHKAVSNTLPEMESVRRDTRRVLFRRTPPLPTYLVAIMTGPFEFLPIPGLGVPGRVVTVRGNAALAGPAARETAPILSALERYFDRKYPYEKLDLIGVPEFSSGAMENAAAITFRENYLLYDPKAMSPTERRRLVSITAHELAHMWFGDLVTMKWWDDLWLNESFASWLGDKMSDEVAPQLRVGIDQVNDALRAMTTDSRLTTRAIRARQLATDDLGGIFDVLSYDKGQSVLVMLERWLGPERFREGVRAYIKAHEFKNASASDLWASLSRAAYGLDVTGVAQSFLDQPGVPIVTVEPLERGGVRLSQRRFLVHGLTEPGRARWKIPVTLRYGAGDRVRTKSVLLEDSSLFVQLDAAPDWVHPNAEEQGYYRWSLPPARLAALADGAERRLSVRERIGFLGNARALMVAGELHGDQYFEFLSRFARHPEPEVVNAVLEGLNAMKDPFLTAETRDHFAAFVRRTLRPALERIGLTPAAEEPQRVTVLRPALLMWLGEIGKDPEVLQWARTAAAEYMKSPTAMHPSLYDPAINLAALQGDAALFETYRARFESATVPVERQRFLTGLSMFDGPELVGRALRYAIEGPLRPQEITSLAGGVGARPGMRDRVFEWSLENHKFLSSRVPPTYVANLPRQAAGCSLERAAKARSFYSDPAHQVTGTLKELEKVEAAIRECAELQQREGAAVARYLKRVAD